MARAFIAAVPLALVLVAALVVPVALTPGTFGFHDWPTAKPERVAEDAVPSAGAPVALVPPRTTRARGRNGDGDAGRAPGNLVAVRPNGGDRPSAAPRDEVPAPAPVPGAEPDARGQSTGGPGAGSPDAVPAPTAPAPDIPEPGTPAGEGEGEDAPPPVQVAEGVETPVLRGAPLEPELEIEVEVPPVAEENSCSRKSHGPKRHRHKGSCDGEAQESSTEGS